MKRLISANSSEILKMSASELKQSIKASEGRVVLSENIVFKETFIDDITNSEIARAFGADLILLNGIDVLNPRIFGLELKNNNVIDELHKLVGTPIGVNLEPVDEDADMMENEEVIVIGRQANKETLIAANKLGLEFICLTGNPATGVSNRQIISAINLAKEYFSGLIIAGKMHSSGVDEAVIDEAVCNSFLDAGADIILVPAVGTIPGFTESDLVSIVKEVHKRGGLVMSTIGTSQETSDTETVKQIAIRNKICGVDIQHIGDAGYGGLANVENIFALSQAIRGLRHTVSRMARSVNR